MKRIGENGWHTATAAFNLYTQLVVIHTVACIYTVCIEWKSKEKESPITNTFCLSVDYMGEWRVARHLPRSTTPFSWYRVYVICVVGHVSSTERSMPLYRYVSDG